jgi:hypothetical protein
MMKGGFLIYDDENGKIVEMDEKNICSKVI